jgi:hypothetical protein
MLDFSTIFLLRNSQGIDVTLYDNKGKTVTDNYAISYKVTGIMIYRKSKIVSEKDRPSKRSNCTTIKKMNGFTEKSLNLQMKKDLQTDKEF